MCESLTAQTLLQRESTLTPIDWASIVSAPSQAQPWRGEWLATGAETEAASRLVLDPFGGGGPRAAFDWRQAVGTSTTLAYQSELRVVGLPSAATGEEFDLGQASLRQMNRLNASWRPFRHWTTSYSSRWTQSLNLEGEASSGEFQQQWETGWTVRPGTRLRSSLQRTVGFHDDVAAVATDRQLIGWSQDLPRLSLTVGVDGITEARGRVGRPAENTADRFETRIDWKYGPATTVSLGSNLFRRTDTFGRPTEEGLHLRSRWVQQLDKARAFEFETHWRDIDPGGADWSGLARGTQELRSTIGLRLGETGSLGLDSHWREESSGATSTLIRDELRLRVSPQFALGAGLAGRVDLLYGFKLGSAASLPEPESSLRLSIGGRW